MTLKSLANHFNLERVKKYGSFQALPSKMKPKTSLSSKSSSSVATPVSTISSSSTGSSSVPSCRSSKVRPQLNSNARKMAPKNKRCKASVLLDQIPVCKLQKTLIKYGCCHNLMQNVISLDYYEEYPHDH